MSKLSAIFTLDPREFGRRVASMIWDEHPELHGQDFSFTADQMLGIFVRAGGPRDGKIAASASRYATKWWVAARYLRAFVEDGLASEEQKRALRGMSWIEFIHGFWHLSDAGRAAAERLGFL